MLMTTSDKNMTLLVEHPRPINASTGTRYKKIPYDTSTNQRYFANMKALSCNSNDSHSTTSLCNMHILHTDHNSDFSSKVISGPTKNQHNPPRLLNYMKSYPAKKGQRWHPATNLPVQKTVNYMIEKENMAKSKSSTSMDNFKKLPCTVALPQQLHAKMTPTILHKAKPIQSSKHDPVSLSLSSEMLYYDWKARPWWRSYSRSTPHWLDVQFDAWVVAFTPPQLIEAASMEQEQQQHLDTECRLPPVTALLLNEIVHECDKGDDDDDDDVAVPN